MKDLKGKYYIKLFAGNISAGLILDEFREASNLYVTCPWDVGTMEQKGHYAFATLNDFVIGGYMFFDDVDTMCEELEEWKVKEEEFKSKTEDVIKEEQE